MNFPSALKHFLKYCAVERRLSPHTLQAYELDLKDFRKWLPRGIALTDISVEHLKNYLNDMVIIRKLSPSTVRRRLASLRVFFRRVSDNGATSDPFSAWRLKLPKIKRLPRALSKTEIVALFRHFPHAGGQATGETRELMTVLRLLVATGLRIGELCRLTLSDLSPDCGTLHIRGKGSRDRIIYVADKKLRKSLQNILAIRHKQTSSLDALLVDAHGVALRPNTIRKRLRHIAYDAGVQRRVTPHMLRHTAATLLLEKGVDIRYVQRLLGHSRAKTQ